MGIRPHNSVGVCLIPTRHDHPRQCLDVDLVNDPRSWRNHFELLERSLSPPQELIALAVPLVLQFHVACFRIGKSEKVGDDRVVNDELCRSQRLDLRWVSAQILDGFTHCCEIHDHRYAGEVLHHHPCWGELDLGGRFSVWLPLPEGSDRLCRDVGSILGSQKILQKNLVAERQSVGAGHRTDTENLVRPFPTTGRNGQ